jgi:hypothetical protein
LLARAPTCAAGGTEISGDEHKCATGKLYGAFRPAWSLIRRLTIADQELADVGLIPPGRFEDIGQSTISMMSDGYIDAVRSGAIVVKRDRAITALSAGPKSQLDDGTAIPADLIVAATGFEQDTPFLAGADTVRDEEGNFDLFRRILPHDVANLRFAVTTRPCSAPSMPKSAPYGPQRIWPGRWRYRLSSSGEGRSRSNLST